MGKGFAVGIVPTFRELCGWDWGNPLWLPRNPKSKALSAGFKTGLNALFYKQETILQVIDS
jgi:hypothetical protein